MRCMSCRSRIEPAGGGYYARMILRAIAAVTAVVVLAGCGGEPSGGGADGVQKAIDSHQDQPGMVDFLDVARDQGVLHSQRDVDKIASFFQTACVAQNMGVMQSAEGTVTQLARSPWNIQISVAQAQALTDAHPTLCQAQR
jgi:hypothetical protein